MLTYLGVSGIHAINYHKIRVTSETVEQAVASLTQITEETKGRQDRQNNVVLSEIANNLTDVAANVTNTNIAISSTVSIVNNAEIKMSSSQCYVYRLSAMW